MSQRRPWVVLAAALAVVGAALLIWALSTQSDLDSTRQELDLTIEQLDSAKKDVEEIALHIPEDPSPSTPALEACARAFLAAFGGVSENENAAAVRKELVRVVADCKADLGGE